MPLGPVLSVLAAVYMTRRAAVRSSDDLAESVVFPERDGARPMHPGMDEDASFEAKTQDRPLSPGLAGRPCTQHPQIPQASNNPYFGIQPALLGKAGRATNSPSD